jgi:cytidylate kinase
MALITVSGEPGCRSGEVARLAAQRLGFEHLSASRLDSLMEEEFGPRNGTPEKAWPQMAATILLRLATEAHLAIGVDGAELLFANYPALLRVRIVAPRNRRIGNMMLDDGLERAAARQQLLVREGEIRKTRKMRFGRASAPPESFDLTLNAESLDGVQMAEMVVAAAASRDLASQGFLSRAAEAQLQFRIRLQLAKYAIHPRGEARFKKTAFSHPSEQIFANLLDFYRIDWQYEPRSFPIKWDADGRVLESFTPDFYLPESDVYVELTTMKQSLVTKKNRKMRLLREIYPDVKFQVFYQKDIQDLVFKYGLVTEPAKV